MTRTVTGTCGMRFLMATEPLWNPVREGDFRIVWVMGMVIGEAELARMFGWVG